MAIELFISYSHGDEAIRKQLSSHLAPLQRDGIISEWHDRKVGAGKDWKNSIDEHLERADIILLLVSAGFLASDYCFDIEMKRALERHDAGEVLVIPIIVRACDWKSSPFGHLQALPRDGKPVRSWGKSDEAWVNVASGLRGAVEGLRPVIAKSDTSLTSSSYPPALPSSSTSLQVGAPTRVQQNLLRARMSYYGFEESTLEETLDPANDARVTLFLAHLEESLRTEGFGQSTVDKTLTIASELLTNVKKHAPGSAAHFAMRCRTVPLRYINLCVADDRGGFDLDTMIAQLRLRMIEGEREHGLLRVHRMSSLITVLRDDECSAVLVDIYEKERPPSKFLNIPEVASILLEYENPKLLWLGEALHAGSEVFGELRLLAKDGNTAVLECYFAHLSDAFPKCLFVEVRGHKTPTEQFSAVLSLRAALELHFTNLFTSRRVVLLAENTETFLRREVCEWCEAWGLVVCRRASDAHEAVQNILYRQLA